jgi:hypothetical protein
MTMMSVSYAMQCLRMVCMPCRYRKPSFHMCYVCRMSPVMGWHLQVSLVSEVLHDTLAG